MVNYFALQLFSTQERFVGSVAGCIFAAIISGSCHHVVESAGEPLSSNVGNDTMQVEIKINIRPDEKEMAEDLLSLDFNDAEERQVYFYDTLDLKLFNQGIVLRSRKIKNGSDDSTLKLRPFDFSEVSSDWLAQPEFKVELDYVGDRKIPSASFTATQERGEIDAVANGKRALSKLFSENQERFLWRYGAIAINFTKLNILGPTDTRKWKLERTDFPYPLCAEHWHLPDGRDLLEVSIKTQLAEADVAGAAFRSFLEKHGLDPSGTQETKTRAALDYFTKTQAALDYFTKQR